MREIAEKEENKRIVFNQTPDSTFTEQIKQLKNLQAEYERLGRSAQLYRVRVREENREIEYTSMAYAEMEKREKKLVQEVKERAAQEQAAREALQKGLNGLHKAMETVFSAGWKFITEFSKSAFEAAKKLNVFTGLSKAVAPALKKTGELLKKAFILGPVEKGLELLRTKMLELAKSDRSLNGALESLKSALVTAFMPIYQAALPPLTALLRALTQITQAVGRFIAVLFGGTGKRAQDSSKALEEETKALKGTGAAAEEAAGSLAAFDEINTIETEDKAGRGGGGGSTGEDGSAAAPELSLDETVFSSWGEAFSTLLDEILDRGLPRLRKGFERFAGWFNSFSQKLYDMFTFKGVRDKVRRIGRELAAALNKLAAGMDWRSFGAALGAGLDLAVQFAVQALFGVDWSGLGADLAEWINGVVAAIDWQAVGQLLWSGFKIAIDLLAGLLLSLDMVQLARAANQMVTGFLDAMLETIRNTDWEAVGEQIKLFFANLDWNGIAIAVSTAIGTAFGALGETLLSVFSGALEQVREHFDDWTQVANDAGVDVGNGLLMGIGAGIGDIFAWLLKHITSPFIEGFKKIFGIHSPSTVMAELGGLLMDGLLEGILGRFAPVLESVKTVLNGILQFVTGVFTGDWGRAWEGVSGVFRGVWNGIVSVLEGAVNLIISGINWMLSQLNRLRIDFPAWLGGGSFGFNIPLVSGVSIPRLAQGAVIPPNREFMAVLGDQKSGTNIEAPEDLIRRIVREESGGGNEALLREILQAIKAGQVIKVDGTTFGRTAIRSINGVNRAAGRQLLDI